MDKFGLFLPLLGLAAREKGSRGGETRLAMRGFRNKSHPAREVPVAREVGRGRADDDMAEQVNFHKLACAD
jgi:hypothetical protein